jgi:catalase
VGLLLTSAYEKFEGRPPFHAFREKVNIVGSPGDAVRWRIQELQGQHFHKADPAYGEGVAKDLGWGIKTVVNQKQATAAD